MAITWSIRLKALLMLVAFAVNFTVFCHCATAQKHSCCCQKQTKTKPCNSARAVKFNLAEKQLADYIQPAPLPVIEIIVAYPVTTATRLPEPAACPNVKHPPPDILTLQQRFLI